MTYFQLERMTATEATMTSTGYSPASSTTIRLDEQSRTGMGVEATRITGLGLSPVAITATPSQVGAVPRFVRKLPRDIDITLNIHAANLTDRRAIEDKISDILSGECLLRRCSSDGGTTIALPSNYHYLRVFFVGGGTYALGDGKTKDTELELVITLRAHKPDWKIGG